MLKKIGERQARNVEKKAGDKKKEKKKVKKLNRQRNYKTGTIN